MSSVFRYDGSVNDAGTGVALQGVEVYICNQPANTANLPPFPLAAIFTDSSAGTPLPNPVTTDGLGNFFFYAAVGFYTLVYFDPFGRMPTVVFPDQDVGSASSAPAGQVVALVNSFNLTSGTSGTLFSIPAAAGGMYRASVDLICTTGGFAGNVSASVAWNNGTTSASATSYQPLDLSTAGELAGQSVDFYAAPSTAITYSTIVTGGAGSVYALRIRLEYIEVVTSQLFTQFVQSVNGLSGPVSIIAGPNITVSQSGQIITVSSTGGGGGGITPPAGDIGGTTSVPTVISTHLGSPLPIAQGGSGSAAPSLIAGSNVTITGSWPNQTVASSVSGIPTFIMTPQSTSFSASIFGSFYQTTTGAATIIATIPTAIGNKNQILLFNKMDIGAGTVVLTPFGGQTIGGFATFTLIAQGQFMGIVSDGSNWIIWTRN